MNTKDYLQKKAEHQANAPQYRTLCFKCIQPTFSCYCKNIKPISCPINFVILIHPIEAKRRIATGRMSHLCLQGSYLIKGQNFSDHPEIDSLIADPEYHSVILYPGQQSVNLSLISKDDHSDIFPSEKKLRIFVIDGTWATARRMVRQSNNINKLPRISFNPPHPSNFRVRKQPASHCYSTIEAVHHTIELLGPSHNFNITNRPHDHLLHIFNMMVENQLRFLSEVKMNQRKAHYRREAQLVVSDFNS
ncbi:MAG: DTW domain-containing protein [Bdellovibrionaceae bacterium]|nr:DTW domain-containing protein [Pseudobdellovibrionaceae bacterium]